MAQATQAFTRRHGGCALLLAVLASPALFGQQKTAVKIMPDADVQGLIRQVVYAPEVDDAAGGAALTKLQELARKSPEKLAPQLIHYCLHVSNEKEGVGVIILRKHFAALSVLRQPLLPLLESVDPSVHHEVATWLQNIDGALTIPLEANLLSYRRTLLQKKEAPPPGLVRYLFDVSPSQALLLLGEVNAQQPQIPGTWPRDLLWSDHVVTTIQWRLRHRLLQEGDLEKAQRELSELSRHEGWYARRYVAEMIRAQPKFGTAAILERLKKDDHPLVREAAKLLK